MEPQIRKIIAKAKHDPAVLAVALFGSYARGEAYHDIDICIFLCPAKYGPEQLSKIKLGYTPTDGTYDVQVFQQLPLYIRKRILKDGKILYCKDEDMLYDLYFETLRDYSHYEPIYEGYLEAVANG